jgi:WG containing repeat
MEVYQSNVDTRYSVVKIAERFGIMNEQGTIIVPCIYRYIAIESVKDGIITTCVRHIPHESLHFTEQGKRLEPLKHVSGSGHVEEGRLAVENKQHLWGFVDESGTIVIECQYGWVHEFKNGYAQVQFEGKWGLIDRFGKIVVPVRYDRIIKTQLGQLVAQQGQKWGFMRIKTGKIVQWRYDDVFNIGNHRWIGKKSNRWALLTLTGRELTGFDFDEIKNYQNTPYLLVRQGVFYGLISNETGVITLPIAYQKIGQAIHKHYLAVRQLDKWGFINRDTLALIIDCQYDAFQLFHFITVQSGEKWGLLNETLMPITPFNYDNIEPLLDQTLRLQSGSKYAVGNLLGQQLTDFQYDTIVPFMENLLKVQIGHKFGVIDTQGNSVIGVRYHEIHPFVEDMARVVWGRHIRRYGFVNRQGEEMIPPIYDYAYDFSEGLALVSDFRCGFIDKQGNVIIPFIYWGHYIAPFNKGLAVAGLQYPPKMGIINRNNEIIIPFEYDMVWGVGEDGLILAEQNGNALFFDVNGVIQPDHIRDYGDDNDYDTIKFDDENEDND